MSSPPRRPHAAPPPRIPADLEWLAACCVLLRARGSCSAVRAACRTRATPQKKTRPNARLIKFAIINRALSSPWQHPDRSELINPFSAQSDTNFFTLRESSPRAPTTRPIAGGIDLSKIGTGPGLFRTYSTPLNLRSALLRALTCSP